MLVCIQSMTAEHIRGTPLIREVPFSVRLDRYLALAPEAYGNGLVCWNDFEFFHIGDLFFVIGNFLQVFDAAAKTDFAGGMATVAADDLKH